MARRRVPIDVDNPYHVSSRCINRDWFGLSMDLVWKVFSAQLYFTAKAFNLRIHAFVLMNNHFHLIVSSPEGNLSSGLGFFLRETSRELTKYSGRINQTWGGRFFRSRLGSYHYYTHAYKYLYRNPVEAGIAERVESYPFSTLSGILGKTHLLIPVIEDCLIFDNDVQGTLAWLNRKPNLEQKESVRRALRRGEFSFGRNPKSKRANQLETQLY